VSGVQLHVFLISAQDGGGWVDELHALDALSPETPWYTLHSRLRGPQSQSDHHGEGKSLPMTGVFISDVQPVARHKPEQPR
jgi:hypothetical protein